MKQDLRPKGMRGEKARLATWRQLSSRGVLELASDVKVPDSLSVFLSKENQ
jgi:hypothetical protein